MAAASATSPAAIVPNPCSHCPCSHRRGQDALRRMSLYFVVHMVERVRASVTTNQSNYGADSHLDPANRPIFSLANAAHSRRRSFGGTVSRAT